MLDNPKVEGTCASMCSRMSARLTIRPIANATAIDTSTQTTAPMPLNHHIRKIMTIETRKRKADQGIDCDGHELLTNARMLGIAVPIEWAIGPRMRPPCELIYAEQKKRRLTH